MYAFDEGGRLNQIGPDLAWRIRELGQEIEEGDDILKKAAEFAKKHRGCTPC